MQLAGGILNNLQYPVYAACPHLHAHGTHRLDRLQAGTGRQGKRWAGKGIFNLKEQFLCLNPLLI